MSEQTNPTPEPNKTENAGLTVFWLLLAFAPSLASIPLMRERTSPDISIFIIFLAAACCLGSAFGILRGVKSQITRILLGLFLAGFFFVLNAIIVVLVGCSHMNI